MDGRARVPRFRSPPKRYTGARQQQKIRRDVIAYLLMEQKNIFVAEDN
jgi:hypothetical protein